MNAKHLVATVLHKGGLAILIAAIGGSVGCMTTYDAYGNPVQSVDPAAATAGIAAAGLIGYALANDNDNNYHHRHHGYYRPPHGHYRRY